MRLKPKNGKSKRKTGRPKAKNAYVIDTSTRNSQWEQLEIIITKFLKDKALEPNTRKNYDAAVERYVSHWLHIFKSHALAS